MEDDERIIHNIYRIIDPINESSFGFIYLVNQINNNNMYALKESRKEKCPSYKREIRALNKISEYKISRAEDINYKSYKINMIDNFEEEDDNGKEKIYIVLEYMPNKSLFEYFANNQTIFSIRCSKYLFSKILKGVQEIHNSGLCHLDLKLENILLDKNYNPIICDFGYCMNSSEKIRKYFSSPGYGPKEIFESKPYDGIKADIFSLGVILFYIVTNKSIFYESDKFKPYINNKYKKYINQDKFYKLIIERKNNDYWNVVVGEELHLPEEFKDLVINMIAYDPEERFSLNQIINHPWFEEINNLTDEEKIKLEKNVKEELEEILKIKNQNNENNFSNKKCLFDENQMEITANKSITDKIKEDIFTENFELKEVNEENLDMKNYFKINGEISPIKFMNLLYYKLSELENNKGNDNRIINIESTGKGFEIDIKFESDNEEIIEEFEEDGIEVEEIEDYLNQLDLTIRVKLFKAQNGHLIKVFRKNGTYEDFNFYLGKIMKLIKELFDDI